MSEPRISSHELMLQMAETISLRSTCSRLHVGALVTDSEMLNVLGYGYNGNAAGLSNSCDRDEPGNCGCVHAELNALLKAPGSISNKKLFTTVAPCVACAKAIINAGISEVYYRVAYRSGEGLRTLMAGRVRVFRVERDGTRSLVAYASDTGVLTSSLFGIPIAP